MHHKKLRWGKHMNIEQAKKFVAKKIGFKSYTCQEIYRKLVQSGCEKEVAEETVSEFCKAGILNDEEYTKMYIHDAASIGFKGMYRIRQELGAKGISSTVIDRAISDTEIDEGELLEKYVLIRFGESLFADFKELEKAKTHLMRRGYGIYEINRCFKKLGIGVSRGDID